MTCCTISRSLRLLWLLTTAALAAARSIDKRGAQSEVRCSSDYNWAGNSESLSPCTLTAVVWGACFTGNWDVPVLLPGNEYNNPNSTTASQCTCSWAAYNLISACTLCQGLDASVQAWATYDQNCAGFLTDTYFPSNVALPSGTKIPFWAGTNPTTWMNARFNSAQAQALANEGKPDLVQGQESQDSGSCQCGGKVKAPIGAIVGGVVGGLAVGGLAVVWGLAVLEIGERILFFLFRKSTRHGVGQPRILRRSVSHPSHRSIHTPEDMSFAHRHPGDAHPLPHVMMNTSTSSGRVTSEDMSVAHRHPGDAHLLPQVLMNTSTSSGRVTSEDVSFAHRHPGDAHTLPHLLRNTSTSSGRITSSQHAQLQLAGTSDLAYANPFEPATSPAVITGSGSERTLRDAYNTQEVAAALASTPTATVEHSEPARPNLRAYTLDPFRSLSGSPEPADPTGII